MMLALALVLSLQSQPTFTPWRAWDSLFRTDQEGTNFAAHVGWSFAVPLAGHALYGKKGAYIAGGAWVAYALIDEATHIGTMHMTNDARRATIGAALGLLGSAWNGIRYFWSHIRSIEDMTVGQLVDAMFPLSVVLLLVGGVATAYYRIQRKLDEQVRLAIKDARVTTQEVLNHKKEEFTMALNDLVDAKLKDLERKQLGRG